MAASRITTHHQRISGQSCIMYRDCAVVRRVCCQGDLAQTPEHVGAACTVLWPDRSQPYGCQVPSTHPFLCGGTFSQAGPRKGARSSPCTLCAVNYSYLLRMLVGCSVLIGILRCPMSSFFVRSIWSRNLRQDLRIERADSETLTS